MSTARVLDPCSASRMMWFDRSNPDAIFGDKRAEEHVLCDGRSLRIHPDLLMDFTALPFPDGRFNVIAFDPPHLFKAGPKSWMAAKYGKLSATWQDDLRAGFAECFRVLAPNGVLILKWNETQIKLRDVLALTPVPPLFGHTTNRSGQTHWVTFIKPKELAA